MRNSPRSSVTVAAVAAATLVGLSSDTAEGWIDQEGDRIVYLNGSGLGDREMRTDKCPKETQKLAHKLQLAERELQTLRAQTKAQAEQIDGLLMERDTAEAVCATACEDTGETYSGEYVGIVSGMEL